MQPNSEIQQRKKNGFRPGVNVKNDKLYVFASKRVVVIRGWPVMAAWTKTDAHPNWCRFRPNIDIIAGTVEGVRSGHRFSLRKLERHELERSPLPLPDKPLPAEISQIETWQRIQAANEAKVIQYFQGIPTSIYQTVSRFCTRQWHLLSMMARCQAAEELLSENPALGYALASNWAFTPNSSSEAMRFIRRAISNRRRVISGQLGFPTTEEAVSVLKKVVPTACNVSWLLTIRDLLHDNKWRKVLRHMPSLNVEAMMILTNSVYRSKITPSFLHEIAARPERNMASLRSLFLDSIRMEKELELNRHKQGFRSIRSLKRYHDQLVESINERKDAEVMLYDFPPAPFKGTAEIIPIDNPRLLIQEAREQHNCVLSYVREAAQGSLFFYRVLKPERATVSIIPGNPTGWKVGEIAGTFNKSLSEKTINEVRNWLRDEEEKLFPF